MTTTAFHPEPPGISKHSKKALARGLKLMYLNGKDFGESNHKVEGTHSWWNLNVENMYRCQVAGYRDEKHYLNRRRLQEVDKWPDSGLIRKLVRWDGNYYYFGEDRECPKLTSSDVRKALLRETVIFEKSPFTNESLRWAPVLSKMTQKYNEALAEIVSQNPRPQKKKPKKRAHQVSPNHVQFINSKRKNKIKASSKIVTKRKSVNKNQRNIKQFKRLLYPKVQKSTQRRALSMKRKSEVNTHSTKSQNLFTNRQRNKSLLQIKSKLKQNIPPICTSLQRIQTRHKPNIQSISFKTKYGHMERKCGEDNSNGIKYLPSSSSLKSPVFNDKSILMSNTRNNKTVSERQRVTMSNIKVTTERYPGRSLIRTKRRSAANYWFPEESVGDLNNHLSTKKSQKPLPVRKPDTQTSPVYPLDNNRNCPTFPVTVQRNPSSIINTNKFRGKTSENCDVQERRISHYETNVSERYKWTQSSDMLKSNYDSFSKGNPLSKSKSVARTGDKDFVLRNSNQIQNRKVKSRSKLYLTKIDVDDCLFSERNESPAISSRSSRLNSCGAVIDLSVASRKDSIRTKVKKLIPNNEMGDSPKISPYNGSKWNLKLQPDNFYGNNMAFSNVELTQFHLPSYRKYKNPQTNLILKNKYHTGRECNENIYSIVSDDTSIRKLITKRCVSPKPITYCSA